MQCTIFLFLAQRVALDAPKEVPGTPNKNIETVKVTPDVRRSPRKHASSNKAVICLHIFYFLQLFGLVMCRVPENPTRPEAFLLTRTRKKFANPT